jgi:hypothetical protein
MECSLPTAPLLLMMMMKDFVFLRNDVTAR